MTDWYPDDKKYRLQGKTAGQIIAEKNGSDRTDAFEKSFVLQTNKVTLEDLTSHDEQTRAQSQQVINEALYKGLHAKAAPKLENVEVIHEGLNTQTVKFTWSVQVVPAVLDLDPAATVDKVQAADEEKHRDPVVSREARPS